MTGVEITLILVGIIFVLVSFFVQEKLTPKDVQEITRLSEKELKIIVERELKKRCHLKATLQPNIRCCR